MTNPADRLLADAMERAGALFAEEADLGELLYRTADGGRAYLRTPPWGSALTLIGGGRPTLTYELVGIDLRDLA